MLGLSNYLYFFKTLCYAVLCFFFGCVVSSHIHYSLRKDSIN